MSEFELVEIEPAKAQLRLAPGSFLEYTESQLAEALRVAFFLALGWWAFDSSVRKTDWFGVVQMALGVALLMAAAYGIYRCSNPPKHRLVVTDQRLSWGRVGLGGAQSLRLNEVAGVILDPHDAPGVRVLVMDGSERVIEWDFFRAQERPDHFFLRNGIELIESEPR